MIKNEIKVYILPNFALMRQNHQRIWGDAVHGQARLEEAVEFPNHEYHYKS